MTLAGQTLGTPYTSHQYFGQSILLAVAVALLAAVATPTGFADTQSAIPLTEPLLKDL
jgi:hypothetical protein